MKDLGKCICVLLCIFCGACSVIFAPELYDFSSLNIGPSMAMGFATCGALIWDSVDDKRND